ncbi:MAG: hypothetical protein GKR92_11300 [Gammaproteobacteria bacterium]|nr:MAG: hypothetical protein GKR92_11300 [Gammaproteobacteria bacterium]
MRIFTFKNLRILILISILGAVLLYTQDQRLVTQGWYKPLEIVIFPINADSSNSVDQYIENLSTKSYADIDKFIKRESKKYDVVSSTPTSTTLGERVTTLPPKPPGMGSNPLAIAFWSMKLRWWAMQNTPDDKSNKHRVRIFVLYHDDKPNLKLEHSLGIQKGLLGIVHAFASNEQSKQNNIVVTHELLHTVGASDKYDAYGNPIPPDGLGEPNLSPLYPQKRAEIMAGTIASSAAQSKMARSLKRCVVGEKTAREIGWLRN